MASVTDEDVLPRTRTPRELWEDSPEDGNRYELLDGMLVVSPPPGLPHQDVVGNLHLLLRALCPPDLKVVLGPFAVSLSPDSHLEPDLLVAPRTQFTSRDLPGAPLLVVEVASPSTRRYDRVLKRERYERAGVASYWLLDPVTPAVTVLALQDGAYAQVGQATGAEALELTAPFPVRLVPDDLLD